ncbi:non-ribosomal peptide synthetase [Pseudomonas sp. RIT-PI-S]|uniref:non-ribosomal peptide synthetase n=1 Tax=Pseudomonas sp. RIT-PI-S TaxID=3035295 RepID=UPI0021DA6CEF|nr:non-ribosomal peptide synthetase [Pseudomonas sp. RIT-PI-S]
MHCVAPGNAGVTPSDFPLAKLSQAQLDALPIAAAELEDLYPLSPMQQGMLFHSLSDDGDGLYVNQLRLPVDGLDIPRFIDAWQAACQRHPILRTSFQWHSSEPLQRVHRHAPLAVEVIEQADWPADPAWIDALCEAQLKEGFDLTRLPLQRLRLVTDGGRQQCLVWTSHHILMDGWSSSRLFGEVMQHYGGAPVPSAGARYRDFVGWLLAQDRNAAQAWWRERLAPLEGPCLLAPACWPRPQAGLSGHAARYTHWDAARTGALLHFARARGITPNTLIQAAWLLLLQRYTGQAAVCFGATVAGRPDDLPGAHDMLGLFINTLPVIEAPAQHARVADWLPRLQAQNLDLREQAHVPLAEVQRWSGQGGQALFDSIIVFENYPIDARLQEANDSGPQFGASSNRDVTNVPMDLAVHLGDELSIEFLYLRASFSDEAVDGIRLAFEATLQALLDAPEGYLGNLQRLAPEQCAWLQAHAPAPAPRHRRLSVAALLSERAKAQPDATALNCAGQTLSYGQLLAQAEQLARHLLAHGAGPERRVGVALRRTVELPVALLAVLLSGAAYVPLDLDYPAERLAFMLADADLCLVLAGDELSARVALPPGLACLAPATLLAQPVPAQALPPPHEGLAYLIYTSGSTGLPKAVAVEHGPLSMHCQAIIELYEMVPGTRELHFMSFAFDGAHERWLSTLLAGGTLVLRDDELWTPERTFRALGEQRIDIACFPPAYLQQLASYAQACAEPPPPVRIYCFGGDAVPEPLLEQVGQALRPQYFTNGYGPTETVVTPMLWKVPLGTPCGAACAPIGRAVGQRALWVLDDALEPLPPGVAGELYIGGYGLARGYHGRPGLTAERFVPDPAGEPGARLYRTGDRVRLRDDGVMDYLGRVDQQVKVRGFRIELGEIEARLRRLPGIAEAAVVARDGTAGKQLVAYVVGGQADSETLREQLRERLPAYMVPAQFVHLERLPLSPNGKLDRKALPAPQATAVDGTAPRTTDEALLAEVWAQVLQLERVGIHDNFFELGGDSILSLQVVSRLRNHPKGGRVIKLRDLMQFPTIAQLCERALAEPAAPVVAPEPRASAGNFGLVPVQAWFFEQAMVDPHHFNQALMLRARVPLAADALEAALRDLLAHHSSLRLCFFEEAGAWRQAYGVLPPQPLLWQAEVADAEALEALAERAQGSLDLADGPLLRAVHAKLPDGEARLLLVIHHLAVDAVSWRVLLEDLRMAYEARCAGSMAQLADTGSAYRAWAEQLAADAPARVERELEYWLRTLGDAPAGFPCDNPRGRDQVRHLAYATLGLDAGATERLLKQAPKAYGAQINDLLLAALARVLCRWTGEASTLVQLEGHGREDVFDGLELSRTSGWFTTLYPVRLAPGAGASLRASVTVVREQLATVPDKGVGYGVLRYLAGRPVAERLAALPQARVTFNYLGQFDQAFDEQALLVPANESHGEAYGPQAPLGNWLEIVGQVYDGRLTFRCLYSTRRYRAATVEALVQALEAELQALVEPTALSGLPL